MAFGVMCSNIKSREDYQILFWPEGFFKEDREIKKSIDDYLANHPAQFLKCIETCSKDDITIYFFRPKTKKNTDGKRVEMPNQISLRSQTEKEELNIYDLTDEEWELYDRAKNYKIYYEHLGWWKGLPFVNEETLSGHEMTEGEVIEELKQTLEYGYTVDELKRFDWKHKCKLRRINKEGWRNKR